MSERVFLKRALNYVLDLDRSAKMDELMTLFEKVTVEPVILLYSYSKSVDLVIWNRTKDDGIGTDLTGSWFVFRVICHTIRYTE